MPRKKAPTSICNNSTTTLRGHKHARIQDTNLVDDYGEKTLQRKRRRSAEDDTDTGPSAALHPVPIYTSRDVQLSEAQKLEEKAKEYLLRAAILNRAAASPVHAFPLLSDKRMFNYFLCKFLHLLLLRFDATQ
jgi:hypothetical protein